MEDLELLVNMKEPDWDAIQDFVNQAKAKGFAEGVQAMRSVVSDFVSPDDLDFKIPSPYGGEV